MGRKLLTVAGAALVLLTVVSVWAWPSAAQESSAGSVAAATSFELRNGHVYFGPVAGTGPQKKESERFEFSRELLDITAIVTGFDTNFTRSDEELKQLLVRLHPKMSGRYAWVEVEYGLRNNTAWKPEYGGTVWFTLLGVHKSGS